MVDEPDAAQIDRLREAYAQLRNVVDRQAAELEVARRDNQALRAKVDELYEVSELTARLGRNAKNPSVPPSSEGLGKKPATRASAAGGGGNRAARATPLVPTWDAAAANRPRDGRDDGRARSCRTRCSTPHPGRSG
ncbi:MAG TPA: hypothetical protein VM324_04935 [Egibacteraceae bacterium]|nr:hypothetical protein [Egibacteraceae bacterium]